MIRIGNDFYANVEEIRTTTSGYSITLSDGDTITTRIPPFEVTVVPETAGTVAISVWVDGEDVLAEETPVVGWRINAIGHGLHADIAAPIFADDMAGAAWCLYSPATKRYWQPLSWFDSDRASAIHRLAAEAQQQQGKAA